MYRMKLSTVLFLVSFALTNCLQQLTAAEMSDLPSYIDVKRIDINSDGLVSAIFSPDGTSIITFGRHIAPKIWNANTGAYLGTFLNVGDKVCSSVVAQCGDGTKIVTTSGNEIAKIWDSFTGECLCTLPISGVSGESEEVYSAVFNPDGSKIVIAFDDSYRAAVWDANTGTCLFNLDHTDLVYSAVFSPDGRKIVTASADKTAKVWDANTGECIRTLIGHKKYVYSAVFRQDGTKILTASLDGTVKIWDANTYECLHTLLTGHTKGVLSAVFSPDGSKIVTTSDETAKIWDANTCECLFTLNGHIGNVYEAIFSPDGSKIVTTSEGTIIVYTDTRYLSQRRQLAQTLTLALHPRLGENSPLSMFPQDLLHDVYLAVKFDHFGKQTQ